MKDDVLGQLCSTAVAAPVRAGEEDALRAAIAALGRGPDAPWARLGTVHFARLVVLDDLPRPGATTLWCSVASDGTLAQLATGIALRMPAEADAVFGRCHDWPGAGDGAALLRWLGAHRVPARYVLAAYPDATVGRVRRALARREAFTRLLLAAQGGARPADLRTRLLGEVLGR